ncbi:hypothetical protein phiPsa347_010 [Pseudomonas phage phiPsa347]|uniref:Uncharacterized protein n=1 Tax=Pseudomonas phage phiPsa347 TaxID=1460364 RepID=A0A7G9V2I6_9CAUD|nr:hypothetical protein QGX18_gp010 [Pseudomonas phage phiPsa347]QNO00492.1 hypothetical protein phiPsa347_010 [Pseudomonas phage phiPsa347]
MSLAKFETITGYRSHRQAQERREWIDEAVVYLLALGIYAQDEITDAANLAIYLFSSARDEGGEIMYSAKEAVDEELTYWGD